MSDINIVVCSEDTEYKVAVKNKLVSDNYEIIGYCGFESDAKRRILGFAPDVVVFALDSVDITDEYLSFIENLELGSTGCSTVIFTDEVSVELVNNAAQHGVRQVIDAHTAPQDFCESISKIVQSERRFSKKINIEKKRRSYVYSFFSGKGGVGKTTISTNLAINLASRGKKTLLIDLDLQFGDADMALDLNPNETIVDLARDVNGISVDTLTSCVATHASGLSVLASPSSPELADYVKSEHSKAILDSARNYYEYIIIDCGCALTDPVITALESSDTIFMVNDVNILSLKRAKLCQNVLTQINQQEKLKIIINKNIKKNNVKISDFENVLGLEAFAVFSNDIKTINDSLNSGQPSVLFKPRAAFSKEMISFADKIILDREGQEGLEKQDAKKKSLLKK